MTVTVCVVCCHSWRPTEQPLCAHDTLAFLEPEKVDALCVQIRDHQVNGIPGQQRRLFS